jgi:adenosylmethionine-8-amino-7-oxononanoate aminotransferase
MFGGLTHRPAVTLAELLVEVTPKALTKVFLADSGSVSVEVALKMALQYHRGRSSIKKTQFVALQSGYHGDTFGAMSVCDPINGMHSAFSNNLMSNRFLPRPPCDPQFSLMNQAPGGCKGCNCHRSGEVDSYEQALENACRVMEETLETHADSIAAVIVEPLVQGAGGMRFYDRIYLQRLRAACTARDILLIADEIATGFGRSGQALFACQEAGIEPDIMCVGKALTAGYMTLAACLATEEVAEAVSTSTDTAVPALPLMHGPTFMGNSLACAVAAESLLMLMEETQDGGVFYRGAIQRIEEHLRKVLLPVAALDTVADVRVRGGIGVIERKEPVDMAAATSVCSERGAWLRPFGRLVYTMPPYIASTEDLDIISEAMLGVSKL